MALTNAYETSLLELIFTNADMANIGDATGLRGSSTAGDFYIALFTANPTDTGSIANEATYTGYARVSVARSGAQWTVTDDNVVNDNAITFGECTAGSETLTHWGICTASSGSTVVLYGELGASLAVSSPITPQIAAGALSITDH